MATSYVKKKSAVMKYSISVEEYLESFKCVSSTDVPGADGAANAKVTLTNFQSVPATLTGPSSQLVADFMHHLRKYSGLGQVHYSLQK